MDRFEEFQAFVKVVELGGITRAAEQLGVAKSAISRRLNDLEQRLGVQLFQRTTRRMHLTDSGRGFYDRVVGVLQDVAEAEHSVAQIHGALAGRLRIAAPLTFGLMHLSPAIHEFSVLHPGLEFDLDFNDRQVDLIQEGFDLAVRIAKLEDSSFIARRIAPVNSLVCASPDYLERQGAPNMPEDLVDHQCLVYSNLQSPNQWHYHDHSGNVSAVTVNASMHANNGDFLCQAAIAGLGILRSPAFIIYHAIQSGDLVPVLTDYEWDSMNAYVVYPQTRHLSTRVRSFVDFLVKRFEGVPYWDRVIGAAG